jgi:hypothetical protein
LLINSPLVAKNVAETGKEIFERIVSMLTWMMFCSVNWFFVMTTVVISVLKRPCLLWWPRI